MMNVGQLWSGAWRLVGGGEGVRGGGKAPNEMKFVIITIRRYARSQAL